MPRSRTLIGARYDGRRCRAVYGQDVLPSELGCYLGHERILRRTADLSLGSRHGSYLLRTHVRGAQGYFVTRGGAERILAYSWRIVDDAP
ncbi:hypothetical protein SAMN05421720_101413 [Rhodospira trueperi]|uniref:Uncharacterized protein n=1 Tax=Rhodospira trueperi TaxID=69960 RepID=A0A1G6X986_9PROT|nr:hypothetical protein SAMN05421720_101413 [Rhodospira trueperi]